MGLGLSEHVHVHVHVHMHVHVLCNMCTTDGFVNGNCLLLLVHVVGMC